MATKASDAERDVSNPKNEDSPAWDIQAAQTAGRKYYADHVADEPRLDGEALLKLAKKLFETGQGGELNYTKLQRTIGQHPPGPGQLDGRLQFGQDCMRAINDCITDIIGETKDGEKVPYQLSYAQAFELWHILVNQEDLRLLEPQPSNGYGMW